MESGGWAAEGFLDSVFGALGVEFDLRQTCVGKLCVGNTGNIGKWS